MNELDRRILFVKNAQKYEGLREADNSHRQIIDLYNSIRPLPRGYAMTYTDPWCAAFVSAVGYESGMSDIIYPECSCDVMISLYSGTGRWMENDDYVPLIGDLVMYDWNDSGEGDNTGSADHVGIVEAVNGDKMLVIEGNISDRVDYRELNINSINIRGFCLPDFAAAGDFVAETVPDLGTEKPAVVLSSFEMQAPYNRYLPRPFRIIRYGMEGPDIKSIQTLLEAQGYDCGGADGKFYDKSKKALEDFQEAHGLFVDGEFGPASHEALWG